MTNAKTRTTSAGETLDTKPESEMSDAARRLSKNARSHLISGGFSDGQIRRWADKYSSEDDANTDLAGFLEWVATRNT